ncbi:MAG TPA: hypothetical protein VJ851_17075 [Jatrophihabitans sp.]|nr:hypothetical protein [Jatrophihabitans sp.]
MARGKRIFLTFAAGILLIVAGAFGFEAYPSFRRSTGAGTTGVFALLFIAIGVIAILYCTTPYLVARGGYRRRVAATAAARVDEAITKACEPEGTHEALELPALFQLNRRQLDEYQLMTRRQQKSAYLLAQGASVVSLAALIAGVIIAIAVPNTLDKSLGTGLSALGSTMSAFLAGTFFKQRKSADEQMELYYLEPQRTGRLLAAERIITTLEPSDALKEIISAVSAGGPVPGSSPAGPPTAASDGHNGPPYVPLIDGMVDKVLSWEMPTSSKASKDTAAANATK